MSHRGWIKMERQRSTWEVNTVFLSCFPGGICWREIRILNLGIAGNRFCWSLRDPNSLLWDWELRHSHVPGWKKEKGQRDWIFCGHFREQLTQKSNFPLILLKGEQGNGKGLEFAGIGKAKGKLWWCNSIPKILKLSHKSSVFQLFLHLRVWQCPSGMKFQLVLLLCKLSCCSGEIKEFSYEKTKKFLLELGLGVQQDSLETGASSIHTQNFSSLLVLSPSQHFLEESQVENFIFLTDFFQFSEPQNKRQEGAASFSKDSHAGRAGISGVFLKYLGVCKL